MRICTHIFYILSLCLRRVSVSLIDGLCVFRLFDSSKYLTTLRSNISRCQKATTLILINLYNPSFHLWKSSKKSLGTTVFLSWIPAIVTSFSQLHLSGNSCSRRSLYKIHLHFLALYTSWLVKKGENCEKLSRFFVGMENFTFRGIHVDGKSMGKS